MCPHPQQDGRDGVARRSPPLIFLSWTSEAWGVKGKGPDVEILYRRGGSADLGVGGGRRMRVPAATWGEGPVLGTPALDLEEFEGSEHWAPEKLRAGGFPLPGPR